MDLLLTIVVLGVAAFLMYRRGQFWLPSLCLVLMGMALVSGTIRGVVRDTTTTLIDGGSTVVSSIADGISNGAK
jgi:hypothetical protein